MEDLFKKVFYTGIGMVSNTRDSLKKGLDELVKKGKISEAEGAKVVNSMEENLAEKREEFEAIMTNAVGVTMAKLNLPTAEGINRLEKRIKSLEIKVGLLSKELDNVEKAVAPKKKTSSRSKKAATAK